MKQSRRASVLEIVCGTLTGLLVATIANWLIFPLWGYPATLRTSFELGLVFTGISIVRGYLFRRAFEHLRHKGILP